MDPRFAAADAALKSGREQEGVALLTEALSAGPGPAAAYRVLAARLFNARRYEETEHWARAGLERAPKDLDLWNLLGVALRRQRRLPEALAALDKAHKLNPKNLMPLVNKAHVLNDLQDGARALEIAQRLARQQPGVAEHQRTIATAYRNLGQLDNAAARLDMAVKLQPALIDAWMDRISIASGLQKHDEAAEVMERALKANPDHPRLAETQIILLRRAGRRPEAEALLRARIAEGRAEPWTYYQLARTVADFNRKEANGLFQQAVELAPGNQKYLLQLAESLERSRYGNESANIQQGYDTLRDAMKLGPIPMDDLYAARQIALRVGDYTLLDELSTFEEYGRYIAKAGMHGPLLQQLARVKTPQDRFEILKQHRLWGETVEAQAARNPIRRPPRRPQDGRIRLGFISSDLRDHPVGYFALPLFQHLDRDRFDLYAYSFYTGAEDPTQKYIASRCAAFRWIKHISDRDAAQMVADDQLDMLIELGGSTHMNKLEVLAYRAARLQASWMGYPHSAGLSTIDYLVADPYMKPPNPELLIEKPMVMPHTWLALGPAQFHDDREINPVIPELRNGFLTFGTANNPHKYSKAMLATWARVVASVPESRFLWVRPEAATPSFRQNMLAAFAEQGVGPERVRFEAVRGAHLPFYNEIDIALDCFPLTGGTTTCETLWMGVPVVSLVGEALFERLSYSLLTNAGLPDLAVDSVERYVETALKLAADQERRKVLRTGLREQIKAGPLGQLPTFARNFYDLVAETVRVAG